MKCKICPLTSGIDMHHEIPQAYGGKDGPQTPLCGGHHTLIHSLALKLYKHKNPRLLEINADVPKESREELLRMVSTIVIARLRYEAARKTGVAPRKGGTVNLTGTSMNKVAELARILNCSQNHVVQLAVNRLHQSSVAKKAKGLKNDKPKSDSQ